MKPRLIMIHEYIDTEESMQHPTNFLFFLMTRIDLNELTASSYRSDKHQPLLFGLHMMSSKT